MGCSPWGLEELDTTERLHFHFSLSCIGEGSGIPLQYSCLENPTDGGAWWAAVYGATQSRTRQKRLSGRRAEESEKLSLTLSPFLSEQFGLERVILTSQRLRFPICKLELLPPRLNQGTELCKGLCECWGFYMKVQGGKQNFWQAHCLTYNLCFLTTYHTPPPA